jgi:hypothetical protein
MSVDFKSDQILNEEGLKPVPEVAQIIDRKLQEMKLRYDQVKSESKANNISKAFEILPEIKQ